MDDGESYRGNVSEMDDGDECLYWNSHFILASGVNPFTSFEDKDGLGSHNFCRSEVTPFIQCAENTYKRSVSVTFSDSGTLTESQSPGAFSEEATGYCGTTVMCQNVLYRHVSFKVMGNILILSVASKTSVPSSWICVFRWAAD